jgi:hypothetical protein
MSQMSDTSTIFSKQDFWNKKPDDDVNKKKPEGDE